MEANVNQLRLGQTVYHRLVYQHKEPLKVLGFTENMIFVEGDFSGGTNNVVQRDWLPLKGTSYVYNHAFKEKVRKDAVAIETLAIPCAGSTDSAYKAMMEMVNAVLQLTSDVSMNAEF